ncbi:apyrase-like [Armigeres subalbatus]|uniref:apyrase-like n=1 Tax=Armigeres subalbatus TaxID=124917 RepID=UPI002ED34C82
MGLKYILILLASSNLLSVQASEFKLKIIHFNDLHSRFDEVSTKSAPCLANSGPCIAGVARLVTTIENLKKENHNHLVLNAGDVFQGTIWYNLLKWNVSQLFVNMIKADAMTLGNHEFDDSVGGLVPFLNAIKNVTPVVVSNMVFPQNLNTESKQLKSLIKQNPLILKVGGQSIGIIGVIYDETDKIGNTDPIKFKSSIKSVRMAAKKLKNKGINKIIVLSHCGIIDDRKIAEQAGENIDIIVGGHSHTLLYNGDPPSQQEVFDKYPMVVEARNKHKVLIVQAFCHGHFVGNIDLTFDDSGEITAYEGQPIYQENSIRKHPQVEAQVEALRKDVEAKSSVTVGQSEIELSNDCRVKECSFGSFLADAYVWYFRNEPNPPTIALIHPGNFRTVLANDSITRGQLLTALPFPSNAKTITVPGVTIRKAIEFGLTINRRCTFNTVQIAGLTVGVDYAKPVSRRATILVNEGERREPLNDSKEYDVLVNSYMWKGGDGFDMFRNYTVKEWAPIDAELLERYMKALVVIKQSTLRGPRITVAHEEAAYEAVDKCKSSR